MMEITLGTPDHGWVEFTLSDEGFRLKNDISDVPNDFIDDLMVAIPKLLVDGRRQQVEFSLEPAYYLMTLERQSNGFGITFEMTNWTENGVVYRGTGSFKEIILPICEAIKNFYALRLQDHHWPEANQLHLKNMIAAVAGYQSK